MNILQEVKATPSIGPDFIHVVIGIGRGFLEPQTVNYITVLADLGSMFDWLGNILFTTGQQLLSLFGNFDAHSVAANFRSSVQVYLVGLTFALGASLCNTPVISTLSQKYYSNDNQVVEVLQVAIFLVEETVLIKYRTGGKHFQVEKS